LSGSLLEYNRPRKIEILGGKNKMSEDLYYLLKTGLISFFNHR